MTPGETRGGRRGAPGLPRGLGIGASTGGPRALLALLPGLTLPAQTYAFLVQHIHPKFTDLMIRRLAEASAVPVLPAAHAVRLDPGRLYVAPSGSHLTVVHEWPATYRSRLTQAPPRLGVRPSVDELLQGLAEAFGSRATGVILTGMGRDGLEGARAIKAAGGRVLVEAEATCSVYGMPRVVVEAGLADRLVPIGEMAQAILEACGESSVALPAGTVRVAR